MNKAQILQETGLTEQEFYNQYPTKESYMKRGGTKKQMGGQQEQEQLMAMIQAYAEANQIDPQQIMQQLQEADPETQQQMLQQIMQEMQQMQAQQPQQPGFSMGEEFAMPEMNPYNSEEEEEEDEGNGEMQEGGQQLRNRLRNNPARNSNLSKQDIDYNYAIASKSYMDNIDEILGDSSLNAQYDRDLQMWKDASQYYNAGFGATPVRAKAKTSLERDTKQEGGPSKGGEAGTYMNKTNNFVNWLKNSSQKANQQNMMHMMPDGSMMPNDMMQWGGSGPDPYYSSYSDQIKYKANKENQAKSYIDDQKNNIIKKFGSIENFIKLNPAYSKYSMNKPSTLGQPNKAKSYYDSFRANVNADNTPADVIPKVGTTATNTGTGTGTSTTTGTTSTNTTPNYFSTNTGTNTSTTNTGTTGTGVPDGITGFVPDYSKDPNYQEFLAWQKNKGNQGYQNRGYQNYGYGYGAPNFNLYGNPLMGLFGGLFGMGNEIAGLIQGNMGRRGDRQPGLKGSPNNKPDFNEPRTAKLKWPKQQKERDAFDRHVANDKDIRSDYGSYRDTQEQQNVLKNKIAKENAIKNLGKFKNMPQKFGGLIKAQNGMAFNPFEYEDYIPEEDYQPNYNGNMLNPPTDNVIGSPDSETFGSVWEQGKAPTGIEGTWKDIKGKNLFDKAKGPDAAPEKGKSWGFGNNPWAADETINTIQSITSMKSQSDQSKIDREQKSKQNDIANKVGDTDVVNRGQWLGSSGLAYGALRPDEDIYSGPSAFAKKGGTWFNSNFFQNGGQEEMMETNEENEYNEGDEMYMTDEQIQAFLAAGGSLDFMD